MPRSVPGPGHVRYNNAVLWAGDARRVGLHHRLHGAQIQCPPSASSLAVVVPAATALTDPAPTSRAPGGPNPAYQNLLILVEFNRLHDSSVHAQKGMP